MQRARFGDICGCSGAVEFRPYPGNTGVRNPNDVKTGRRVSNLVNLDVFSAAPIPEPETHALVLAGLFAVGATSKRQRACVAVTRVT